MAPAANDTPPASPSPLEEDEEVLGEGEALEVIDLDEMMDGQEPPDEDEDDDEMAPPPEDNSVSVFEKHEKAVFSGDIHPRIDGLCVTGGEDDKAYVWNWKTGKDDIFVTDFKDSVVFARFNRDGSLLALADMAGNIRVHRVASTNTSDDNVTVSKDVVWEFETSDITWLEWHPGANVLFATTDGSELWMWKIPSGDSKVFLGNGEKAEGGVLFPDGKRVAVGYGDGSLRLFDLKTGDVTHSLTDSATSHSPSPVTALAVRDNLLATGGADGLAKIFNVQSGKNIGTFVHGKRDASGGAGEAGQSSESESGVRGESTVEALLFSSTEQNLLLTGTLEGNVTVWDVSSHVKRVSVNVGDGVVKMAWRKGSATLVYVATLHGKVVVVDARAGKVVGECSGHKEAVLDFAQTSDGKHVLSCSDDSDCRIFDVDKVISSDT